MTDVCQQYGNFALIIARSTVRSLCKSPIPEKNNFRVNFHWDLGGYLIFIVPLIACHNYNLGLKKGFGINWINLAAISCACMLIHSTPSLEKNLIKYTNNTFRPDRKASWKSGAGWNKKTQKKNSVISNLDWSVEEYVLMAVELKSGPTLILISLGQSVSLSSLSICLYFFFFPGSHTNTHEQGCWSCPPLRSSNMQPGSRMIKAVAGGLHFETINRPPRAESNSKTSISVSPSPMWHQGRGCSEGERADSTFASSLYVVAKTWSSYGETSDSLMWFQAGIVDSFSWPRSQRGLPGVGAPNTDIQ